MVLIIIKVVIAQWDLAVKAAKRAITVYMRILLATSIS